MQKLFRSGGLDMGMTTRIPTSINQDTVPLTHLTVAGKLRNPLASNG